MCGCFDAAELRPEASSTAENSRRPNGKIGEHHYGKLRLETAEAKAERIISKELRRLNWKETDLVCRRKSPNGPVRLVPKTMSPTQAIDPPTTKVAWFRHRCSAFSARTATEVALWLCDERC